MSEIIKRKNENTHFIIGKISLDGEILGYYNSELGLESFVKEGSWRSINESKATNLTNDELRHVLHNSRYFDKTKSNTWCIFVQDKWTLM